LLGFNSTRDDANNAHPYDIYVLHGIGRTLVASGTIFEAVIVLHMPYALVLVPTYEVYTVAHAFQSFST